MKFLKRVADLDFSYRTRLYIYTQYKINVIYCLYAATLGDG